MSWQEPLVVLIVGLAVVWLYRHLRGMLRMAKPGGGQQACHGCDDCADDSHAEPKASMTNR